MNFIKAEVEMLKFWIKERESIRIKKETGKSKPWTRDSMLQQYRFCNVHREDDTVTRWIRDNWREPYIDHPNLYIAMIMARLINWPPALEEVGFPETWDYTRYLTVLRNRKMRKEQIWTGAYMVTAGGKRMPKEEAVLDMVQGFHRSTYRPIPGDSLLHLWNNLQSQGILGMGSFLSAQIVADLKFTPLCSSAIDWFDFCAPGPGSQAGLNRLLGLPITKQWNREEFQTAVNNLMGVVNKPKTAQDMQNCLCEFSKYRRGFSRSRYPGV